MRLCAGILVTELQLPSFNLETSYILFNRPWYWLQCTKQVGAGSAADTGPHVVT